VSNSFTERSAAEPSLEGIGAPILSVVVVSFNAVSSLMPCLESLVPQASLTDIEILVVKACDQQERRSVDSLKERFKDVRWVEAQPNCVVPRMRSLGISNARGEIVALLEDDCIVEQGWCAAVIAAHRTHDIAIGGAVEPGPYKRGLDWAVYFTDYGRFMLPLPDGPTSTLPGNNTSYKRAALATLSADAAHEFREVFVHWAWQRARAPMRADQAVRVRVVHSWTFADVTRIPYHHARAFAALRFASQPLWRRMLITALIPLLPVVKVARVIRETISRRRLIGRMLHALPWTIVIATSWSIGEGVGCLCGTGDSASVWR